MKIQPIVYIVPVAILALALALGSTLLVRILYVLLVIGLVGFFWARLGLRGLRLNVGELSGHFRVGDSFKEEFTVTNESRTPKLLVKAEEHSNLPGYRNVSFVSLSAGGSRSWQSQVTCRRRGRYSLGAVTVSSGDPFGLFTYTNTLGKPREIVVFPQVVELPFFRTSLSTLVDFGHGAGGRRISQISPSASSVREMVSGDSQEHIHWRSTAHTGQLMVKVFDAEHSPDNTKNVWIALDMAAAAHCGEGDDTTEEYCVAAAASLAGKYLNDGMRVGLIASGDRQYSLPPGAGEAHFSKLLEHLALMKATGQMPVERLISEDGSFGSNSTIVVVTPQSTEPVVDAMRWLKNYGHWVVAVFADCSSFGGTLAPTHMAHALGSIGVQAYIVRKGESLARALDSRAALWYSRYL